MNKAYITYYCTKSLGRSPYSNIQNFYSVKVKRKFWIFTYYSDLGAGKVFSFDKAVKIRDTYNEQMKTLEGQ